MSQPAASVIIKKLVIKSLSLGLENKVKQEEKEIEKNPISGIPKDLVEKLKDMGYGAVRVGEMSSLEDLLSNITSIIRPRPADPLNMTPEETMSFLHDAVHELENGCDVAMITAAVVCKRLGGLTNLLRETEVGKGDGLDTDQAFLFVCKHIGATPPNSETRATFFKHTEKEKQEEESKGEAPISTEMPIS